MLKEIDLLLLTVVLLVQLGSEVIRSEPFFQANLVHMSREVVRPAIANNGVKHLGTVHNNGLFACACPTEDL